MKIWFDKDIDYAELFFRSEPNYGVDLDERVTQFRSEKDDSVVGYGFFEASDSVLVSDLISDNVKEEFKRTLRKGG